MAARGRPAKQDYPLTDRIGRVEIRKPTPGSAWQARYSTPLGRQEHSLKLRSMDSARHEAARIDQLLECGDYEILTEERATPNLTFAEFVAQELLPKYRGWGDGTRRTAGSYLNSLNKAFGPKLLIAITPRMIEGYLARRRDDPDKPLGKATAESASGLSEDAVQGCRGLELRQHEPCREGEDGEGAAAGPRRAE